MSLKIYLDNDFMNNTTKNKDNKFLKDLDKQEFRVFCKFLKDCYDPLSFRNKESWWKYNKGNIEIDSETAKYFKKNNIWHLHFNDINQGSNNSSWKTIEHEIYPGICSAYLLFYSKYCKDNDTYIKILLFSKHPKNKSWDITKNILSNYQNPFSTNETRIYKHGDSII